MSIDTDPVRGEQWGQGGRYEIRDGVRVRVEEPTVFPPPGEAKSPAEPEQE